MTAYSTPWYFKKKPPIFCDCWRLFYKVLNPFKIPVIIIAAIFLSIATVLLLTAVIACFAITCSGGLISLWPLGFTFLILGILLLHCGWASHLLDDLPAYKTPSDLTGGRDPFEVVDVVPRENLPPLSQPEGPKRESYWQFVDQDAWQAVCSRDNLQ